MVRYEQEQHALFVDLLSGPLLGLNDTAYMRVRRLADSYRFCSWEDQRGVIIGAHFALLEDFFSLPEPPKSLVDDTKWLAAEGAALGLASVDLWWVAITAHALSGDCPLGKPDEDLDAE